MADVLLTPTWTGLAPVLIATLETGSTHAGVARQEILRMARLADLYVASQTNDNA